MSIEHCGFIVVIKDIKPHPNADRLELCYVFGNQVVVNKDVLKVGDLAFYVPSDMQLGEEFCKENNLLRTDGGYLEKNRHVKAIRLRQEFSDGIILPLKSLSKFTDISTLMSGDRITVLNGVDIVKKYVPPMPVHVPGKTSNMKISNDHKLKQKYKYFAEHADTKQLAYYADTLKRGDEIVITEKLHGTSQRTSNTITTETVKRNVVQRAFDRLFNKEVPTIELYQYVSGTRRCILSDFNGGYYGNDEFRKKHHDKLLDKLHPGEEIFYEVVGYVNETTTIMPSQRNAKIGDKEFVRTFGDVTTFTYGCEPGQSEMYVYRMTATLPDGYVVEYPWDVVKLRCEQMGLETVPELDRFSYTTKEDLDARIDLLAERPSTIDSRHIMEGVCVRRNNSVSFDCLKWKNVSFRILEGLIKEQGVADIEEQESM